MTYIVTIVNLTLMEFLEHYLILYSMPYFYFYRIAILFVLGPNVASRHLDTTSTIAFSLS